MTDLVTQSLSDFSEEGVLAGGRGFEFRPQQQQLAAAVAAALQEDRPLLAEAGTGVGKSLAYLLPAIRHALETGRKAIISTHTINLQEQLFGKDIPAASKAIGLPLRAALLKGRANYLCRTRLERAIEQADDLFNQEERRQLKLVREWAEDCGEGWLSDLPPEWGITDKVRAQVCSESHACSLRNCGLTCPYQAARRKVEEADLVVLNHTLFFGLMSSAELRHPGDSEEDDENEDGFLFANDFVVLDEAHTIESVAAHQFGVILPEFELRRDLWRLYNPRTRKGTLRHAATPHLLQLIEEAQVATDEFFERATKDCKTAFAKTASTGQDTEARELRLRQPHWTEDVLTESLDELTEEVVGMAKEEENEITRAELMDTAANLQAYSTAAQEIIGLKEHENSVYWAEFGGQQGERRYLTLRSALINVAPLLREKLFERGRACICTSATLSAGDMGIAYFAGRVGAENVEFLRIGSPFDFAHQMQVNVARNMPDPTDREHYLPSLIDHISRALEQSDGNAFVLFTSYGTLRQVAEAVRPLCREHGWQLLVQGDGVGRTDMLNRFRSSRGSVLLGTDSFWTGVDVPGDALSHVIVVKLPFDSPSNPLVEARCEDITARGGSPFREYSLPEAVLKFRQGVGRLIRSKTDTGMVTLLDSRLCSKNYGRFFLHALPPGAPCVFNDSQH